MQLMKAPELVWKSEGLPTHWEAIFFDHLYLVVDFSGIGKGWQYRRFSSDLQDSKWLDCDSLDHGKRLCNDHYLEELKKAGFEVVENAAIWQKERPDFACVFATRNDDVFTLWQFCWALSENGFPEYYLAWTDNDGNEWGDIEECEFDEYLVLSTLPTMNETFAADQAEITR